MNREINIKLYALSNQNFEPKNSLFPSKQYRVIINNDESTSQLLTNEAYRMLYLALLEKHKDTSISYNEDKNAVMYVDELKPAEISIVQDFLNVWIFTEQKI